MSHSFPPQPLQVIFFYLSCVPKTQHSKTLERFCSIMPTNSGLALRYLLNIPGPLDIPACLCKGNFDDEMFNHQVPYLWLIYWWDIYCGEKCCIRGLHLLFTTELHYIKINLLLKSLKQNWRDAKVYSLLKKIKRRIPL